MFNRTGIRPKIRIEIDKLAISHLTSKQLHDLEAYFHAELLSDDIRKIAKLPMMYWNLRESEQEDLFVVFSDKVNELRNELVLQDEVITKYWS